MERGQRYACLKAATDVGHSSTKLVCHRSSGGRTTGVQYPKGTTKLFSLPQPPDRLWILTIQWVKVKVKVKLFLCLLEAPRHEGVLGEWRYISMHSLTPAPDGGEWSASRSGRFTPRKRTPGTHCIGGCVGPRGGLDTRSKRRIPSPRRESKPDPPIVHA
jgi:hypothetical protein